MCNKTALLEDGNEKGETVCPFCKTKCFYQRSEFPFWGKQLYYGDNGVSNGFGVPQVLDSNICKKCWDKNKGFGLVELDIAGLQIELKRLNCKVGTFFSPLMITFQDKIFLILPFKEKT